MTVENHLVGGEHGHAGDLCARENESTIEATVSVRKGQPVVVDPFRSHFPDGARAQHDTVLFIRANHPEDVTPQVVLTPNAAGTDVCGF